MKFSVCVDAVFRGRDIFESLVQIKKLEIDTFEFWKWWGIDLTPYRRAIDELDMKISCFCTKSFCLTDAGLRDQYIEDLKASIETAKLLGARKLITQVGNELPDIPRVKQHQNIVNGLKACVPILEDAGIMLLFEPLNTVVDHKGYYLYSSDEAFEIQDEVGSPYVKVLFDIYHQQIMEGNLISRITKNIDKIGHFHAAGNPGRHELDNGEINYPAIFKAIDETEYDGYMGLEYMPVGDPIEGLKKLLKKGAFIND